MTQEKPDLSIVIPTYNRRESIQKAIDSVLRQSYTNFEVIVVDDCSTDDTSELIQAFSDDRISYEKLEQRSGACIARNVGLAKSRAPWVAFLDSDDEWLPDRVEQHFNQVEEEGEVFDVYYCLIKFPSGNQTVSMPKKCYEKDIFKELIKNRINIYPTQAILRKTSAEKVDGFDSELSALQDLDFFLRVALCGGLFKCTPRVLATKNPPPCKTQISNSLVNQIEGTKRYEEKWKELMKKTSISSYLRFKLLRGARVNKLCLDQALSEGNRLRALFYLGKIFPAILASFAFARITLKYLFKILFSDQNPTGVSKH